MQRSLARQLRLDDEPSAHDLRRAGWRGDRADREELGNGPRADKGALADMAPQLASALQDRERLAQVAARHAESLAKLALRRQASTWRQPVLGQIGAQLC